MLLSSLNNISCLEALSVSVQQPTINFNVNAYNKSDTDYLDVYQFKSQLNDNIFSTTAKISYKGSFVFLLEKLESITKRVAAKIINKNDGALYQPNKLKYEFHDNNAFQAILEVNTAYGVQDAVIIRCKDIVNYDAASTDDKTRIVDVELYGPMTLVEPLVHEINAEFAHHKLPKVFWYYLSEGSARQRTIMLEEPKPVLDEFYPWMKGGVEAYQKRYLESDASILLLLGPPGTGKTSWTRKMIYDNKLTAVLTFDESIFQMDDFFMNFLLSSEQDILVIEDADIMITDREDHGNKLMSRLLNISDGLIKVSSKKIVFSANLTRYDSIDSALIRPGRCHDVLDFRKLSQEEAQKLAKAAKLKHQLPEQEAYTIAEIFDPSSGEDVQKRNRIGFY